MDYFCWFNRARLNLNIWHVMAPMQNPVPDSKHKVQFTRLNQP